MENSELNYIRMEGNMEKLHSTAGQNGNIPITEPERQYYFMEKSQTDCSEENRRDKASADFLRYDFRLPDECARLGKAGRYS